METNNLKCMEILYLSTNYFCKSLVIYLFYYKVIILNSFTTYKTPYDGPSPINTLLEVH